MDAINLFALIIAVVALIKIFVILVKPRAWYNLAKALWKAPNAVLIVSLILSGVVFYYLIQTMTIVQIMAVSLFIALIYTMTFAVYSNEMISLASKILNDRKFMKKAWLSVIIWLVLILWALKEILL